MKESLDSLPMHGTRHAPPRTLELIKPRPYGFTALSPLDDKRSSHRHDWIYGETHAVCTRCGYTLPINTRLPIFGKQIHRE